MAALGLTVGLWTWDYTTGAVDWSPEQYRLHGVDPAAIPCWDAWTEAIVPEDRPQAIVQVQRGMDERRCYSLAYRTRAGFFLLGRGTPVLDAHGQIERVIGCNVDATQLWQSLSLMRTAAETLAIGLGADTDDPDMSQQLTRQIRDGLAAAMQGIFVRPNK
jgi:hypothetical protein